MSPEDLQTLMSENLAICLLLGYNPRLYFHCITLALFLRVTWRNHEP